MNNTAKKLLDSPRTSLGVASLALVVATVGAVGRSDESSSTTSAPDATATAEQLAPSPVVTPTPRATKRLDVATDVDVSPGATITAAGNVDLGARIAPIDGCIGRYDEVTGVCVLSPGPWELHTGCSELTGETSTKCTVVVKNAGTVPLKFSGYIQVAIEGGK